MKRLLTLWLPLLGTLWLVRTALQAFGGQRAEPPSSELLAVVVIPALQALAVAWLTREPGPSPARPLMQALRRHRTLWALLALDLATPALAVVWPNQAWLAPALGDAPDGSPASILAAVQALGAAGAFLRNSWKSSAPRRSRLLFAAFGLALCALAGLLALDGLTLLGEAVLPGGSPLLWMLCLHAPALTVGLALLFAAQRALRTEACSTPPSGEAGDEARESGEGAATAAIALDAAAACAWGTFLLALSGTLFDGAPPLLLRAPETLLALSGTTALVAAGLLAGEKDSSPSGV